MTDREPDYMDASYAWTKTEVAQKIKYATGVRMAHHLRLAFMAHYRGLDGLFNDVGIEFDGTVASFREIGDRWLRLRGVGPITLASWWRVILGEEWPGAQKGPTEVEMLRMRVASLEFLSDGKQEIWELLEKMREEFDESEYMQGKKDGIRAAIALLGTPEMAAFNRGGGAAREELK